MASAERNTARIIADAMEHLPDELVLDVLKNCQVSDLQSLALVSKQFNRAAVSLRAGLYCINELEEQSLWYNYSLCHYIAHHSMTGRVRTTFTHKPWSSRAVHTASGCPLQSQLNDVVICASVANIDILNKLHEQR